MSYLFVKLGTESVALKWDSLWLPPYSDAGRGPAGKRRAEWPRTSHGWKVIDGGR